jgi:phytoene dehydrogenase-like protein
VTRSPRAQPANEQFDQPGLQMNARFPGIERGKGSTAARHGPAALARLRRRLESLEGGLPTADRAEKTHDRAARRPLRRTDHPRWWKRLRPTGRAPSAFSARSELLNLFEEWKKQLLAEKQRGENQRALSISPEPALHLCRSATASPSGEFFVHHVARRRGGVAIPARGRKPGIAAISSVRRRHGVVVEIDVTVGLRPHPRWSTNAATQN